jgi:hypothetical protein
MQKRKSIFIMGAGASNDAGAPVMSNFLDQAYRVLRYTDASIDRGKFELVFDAINQLQAVFAKSILELGNIESVFAAFEMAELFGRLGKLIRYYSFLAYVWVRAAP